MYAERLAANVAPIRSDGEGNTFGDGAGLVGADGNAAA